MGSMLLSVHACLGSDGKTYFESGDTFIQDKANKFKTVSAQQAFQQTLFQLYGVDSPLPGKLNLKMLDQFDSDESDDFPAGLKSLTSGESFVETKDKLQMLSIE